MAVVTDIGAERGRKRGALRVGFFSESDVLGHRRTANEIASDRLLKALNAYPELSTEIKYSWKGEMTPLPQLNILNMETLAAVLVLLDLIGQREITPEVFRKYLPRVLPTLSGNIKDEEKLQKHREDILRYMRLVFHYRGQREEELQERIQAQQQLEEGEGEEGEEEEDEDYEYRQSIEVI